MTKNRPKESKKTKPIKANFKNPHTLQSNWVRPYMKDKMYAKMPVRYRMTMKTERGGFEPPVEVFTPTTV